MKKLLLLLIILMASVTLVVAQTSSSKALSPQAIYDKWRKSVVTIKTSTGSGTGFFDDSGNLYTAYHVVEGATEIKVIFSDGKEAGVYWLEAADAERDFAKLVTGFYEGWEERETGPKLAKEDTSRVGDRLTVIGSPLGLSGSLTEGLVSAKRKEGEDTLIQMSASISPGSSGSPVFNDNGEVIGMVVSTLKSGQLLNFAITSEPLREAVGVPLDLLAIQAKKDTKDGSVFWNEMDPEVLSLPVDAMHLTGMADLSILIESLPDELISVIRIGTLESHVKTRLISAGFTVVTKEAQKGRPLELSSDRTNLESSDRQMRYAYVNLNSVPGSNGSLAFSISLEVSRAVATAGGQCLPAVVWQKGSIALGGRTEDWHSRILTALDRHLDKLIADWRLAQAYDRKKRKSGP